MPANMTPSGYPRIRVPAAEWEYENYASFKAAMREEAASQTAAQALRNQIPAHLFSQSLQQYTLERQVSEVIRKLTAGTPLQMTQRNSNNADVAMSQLTGLIRAAKGAGYLDMITIKKIQTLLNQLGGKGSRSAYMPHENLTKLLQMLQDKVATSVLDDQENLIHLMEGAIKRNLPVGVSLKPTMSKSKAKEAASQLIGMTMTPQTESLWRTTVDIHELPPTVGAKYSRLPVQLGQLTQGLSQINFFGTLRYFWYSSQAQQEVKAYLAARYLRIFASRSQDAPVVMLDVNGQVKNFTSQNITNLIEGLSAKGDPAAKQAYLKLMGRPSSTSGQGKRAHTNARNSVRKKEGLSQSDIAIRTWIDHKNIGPAQSIPGYIRFTPGKMF